MNLSLSDIITATHGQLIGAQSNIPVTSVSTDTRTIKPGSLYVALKGDRFDGHDFIDDAILKGAVAVLVSKKIEKKVPVILVQDTLQALGDLAHAWRSRFKIPLIGLTGSNGKTTTKEMIAALLEGTGKVLKTEGNLNNLIGLPLTLLQLEENHQFAVIEMGMNHFGEIERLTKIAEPTLALITNVGPAHLEGVGGTLEGVAKAKGELFANVKPSTLVFVNWDDPFIRKLPTKGKTRTYSAEGVADIGCINKKKIEDGLIVQIQSERGISEFRLPFQATHLLSDWMGALSIALCLGVTEEKIQTATDGLKPRKMRGEEIQIKNQMMVIDDTYNANPGSMMATLKACSERFQGKRKIAVLGEMLELGEKSEELHYAIGHEAKAQGFNLFFGYGVLAQKMAEGFGSKNCFTDKKNLCESLASQLKPGDVILVKGSRGSKMEEVVEYLKKG